MTDLSTPAAEGGTDGATEGATPTLAEMEAAAAAEQQGGQDEHGGPEADADGEAAKKAAEQEAAAKVKAPLAPEEVEKRWRQTQGALKQSRADLAAMRRELSELKAGQTKTEARDDPMPDPNETRSPLSSGWGGRSWRRRSKAPSKLKLRR
jgi:hypothetical protein